MTNIQKLQGTKTLLLKICSGLSDAESLEYFTKEDFLKLNKKLFVNISYALVKSINEKYLTSLPWPILDNKQNDVFITELLKIVDIINTDSPWAKIPHYTRSHFLDPRPENDKVVEFLWSMASITIHILADIEPGIMTIDELKKHSDELKIIRKEKTLELEKLKAQEAYLDKNMENLSNVANDRHQELIDLEVLTPTDDFTLPKLLQVQDKLEAQLIELINELSINSQKISVKH